MSEARNGSAPMAKAYQPAEVEPSVYQRWLEALSVPETVTGYREVRYPKQEAARAKAESILAGDDEARDLAPRVKVSLSDQILTSGRV